MWFRSRLGRAQRNPTIATMLGFAMLYQPTIKTRKISLVNNIGLSLQQYYFRLFYPNPPIDLPPIDIVC